mgnify:CR=1 FL=1
MYQSSIKTVADNFDIDLSNIEFDAKTSIVYISNLNMKCNCFFKDSESKLNFIKEYINNIQDIYFKCGIFWAWLYKVVNRKKVEITEAEDEITENV